MKTYIALVRGINVGGHKKFPKADQLAMLHDLKFKNPQVYIHTGNWVFTSESSVKEISSLISESIIKSCGWEVAIVIFSASEFKSIFKNCPFSEEKKENSYFTLLSEVPSQKNKAVLNEVSYAEEEFYIGKQCVYCYSAKNAARVKINTNFIERTLKVNATSRNYKTMTKLIKLINLP